MKMGKGGYFIRQMRCKGCLRVFPDDYEGLRCIYCRGEIKEITIFIRPPKPKSTQSNE